MYACGSAPTLWACTLDGNLARTGGSALFAAATGCAAPTGPARLLNCSVRFNRGRAVVSPLALEMTGCQVAFNTGTAVTCWNTTTATISGCLFRGNAGVGTDFAGALEGRGTLLNCVFRDNTGAHGGAIRFTGDITQCVFQANAAPSGGAAAVVGQCTFRQCTFAENSASDRGGAVLVAPGACVMTNCILWGNTSGRGDQMTVAEEGAAATASIAYCDIEGGRNGVQTAGSGGVTWGAGILNANPRFVDVGAGDLRLAGGSPCIDAGSNPDVPATVLEDLSGRPRFFDDAATEDTGAGPAPVVDLGAYEYQSGTSCRADFTGDGSVNLQDFLAFLQAYSASDVRADWDTDGTITVQDLLGFLATYSGGC